MQFREGADPTATAEYTEESDPVQLVPKTTTISDVDSRALSLVQLNVSGLRDDKAEEILWNKTLALDLGIAVNMSRTETMISISIIPEKWLTLGKMLQEWLEYLLNFLQSIVYVNTKINEPTEGNRTAVFTVFDDENAASDPATVYIIVKRRNDHPDIDLGVGINKGDNLTFVEITEGGSVTGIHISNNPHRIRIIDEEDGRHYIAGVTVELGYVGCMSKK